MNLLKTISETLLAGFAIEVWKNGWYRVDTPLCATDGDNYTVFILAMQDKFKLSDRRTTLVASVYQSEAADHMLECPCPHCNIFLKECKRLGVVYNKGELSMISDGKALGVDIVQFVMALERLAGYLVNA